LTARCLPCYGIYMAESKIVRVDPEVYAALLKLKHELEREQQRQVSMSEAVASALRGER
jgi:hypothetical protein